MLGAMAEVGTTISALTNGRVRVARSPSATLTELTLEALGRPKGSPASWPGAVREALEPSDLARWVPFTVPAAHRSCPTACFLDQPPTPRPSRTSWNRLLL